MGEKIIFIFVIIVALGLGLYLYSSGALVKGVNGFNSLFTSSSTSSTATGTSKFSFFNLFSGGAVQGPAAPTGTWWSGVTPTAPNSSTTGSTGVAGSTGTSTINPADIPAGFTAAQLSPNFHQVRFSGVSAATTYYHGTITLADENYAHPSSTIDVTGWEIRARAGDEYVPKAVNVYDPTGLAPATDIVLKDGDTVSLYSSSAPFNLRLNKCIGYAAHVATFSPPLPLNCPVPDRSQLQSFSGVCQNYIESIGSCQAPRTSGPGVPAGDAACMSYAENNFNYRSCFNAHYLDPNFLSSQVWVWTGSNPVDPYHDSVELLDKNGLLVDLYKY